jgi:hypothetical protein
MRMREAPLSEGHMRNRTPVYTIERMSRKHHALAKILVKPFEIALKRKFITQAKTLSRIELEMRFSYMKSYIIQKAPSIPNHGYIHTYGASRR